MKNIQFTITFFNIHNILDNQLIYGKNVHEFFIIV